MRPGPATKIRHRWVCEKPVDLLLNLSTLSGVTIYIYPAEPMVRVVTEHWHRYISSSSGNWLRLF
jgi:hypothetical protein